MRIARVLHESALTPLLALERDGVLYDVAELDRRLGTAFSPDRVAGPLDFRRRVIALASAGLAELDEALRSGIRPSAARLLPGTFLWLPPCDESRAAFVRVDERPGEASPRYALRSPRALVGNDAIAAFPPREEEPDVVVSLAAMIGEDLHRATADEAEDAIVGYAIASDWVARGGERRGAGRDFATQLGPVLVTKDEVGDARDLRIQLAIDEAQGPSRRVGEARFSIAESIAFASGHLQLRAGDVIAAGPVITAREAAKPLAFGATIEASIDRLGKLVGRPIRGPEPVDWRKRS